MNDHLISLYIDDELSLQEKVDFIHALDAEPAFREDALAFLATEKRLRADVVDFVPELRRVPRAAPHTVRWLRPLASAAAGLAAAALVLWFVLQPQPQKTMQPHRFVIYQPAARTVELAGSFSDWKRIPLRAAGESGYWETTLDLPQGEHRFSYIVEGDRRVADPTVTVRESDDFGGENSILLVKL
jgi:hypothetical protein